LLGARIAERSQNAPPDGPACLARPPGYGKQQQYPPMPACYAMRLRETVPPTRHCESATASRRGSKCRSKPSQLRGASVERPFMPRAASRLSGSGGVPLASRGVLRGTPVRPWTHPTRPSAPERTLIEREELVQKSEEFGLHISDVQRDYVFGWILSGLYQEEPAHGLVLKGGNALRKAWLPETRFSDDLDLSTRGLLDPEHLLTRFNSLCTFVHARTGIRFDLDRNVIAKEQHIDANKRVYKMRLYFSDFSGNADHLTLKVRLDVTEGDRLHLPVQTRRLIHPYSDASDCAVDLQVVKLEEALADKLACLITRRYAYDLFDLVYGLFERSDPSVNRGEVVHTFLRKTAFGRSPVTARDLLINTPLDLLSQYWSKIVCPKVSRFSYDHALQTLKAGVASLFAPFNYGAGHAPAYFPPQLRNAILQAATDLTLLRLVYQGRERLVEPYSLAYTVRRSDGVAQEYFWAYDRTGGRSGPGIKSFVRSGIQGMTNTSIGFQPRFPVELSKAPTRGGVSMFAARSPSRLATAGRRVRSSGGVTYTVECSYCGKRFTRKTSSTRLNPHKDRWGHPCSGRSGYRVY